MKITFRSFYPSKLSFSGEFGHSEFPIVGKDPYYMAHDDMGHKRPSATVHNYVRVVRSS